MVEVGYFLGNTGSIPLLSLIDAIMDDSSLCQLIREALYVKEKAEVLALAIDQLPKIKAYLGKGWLPYYEEALPATMKDVVRNIKRFPQMYNLNLETKDCRNPSDAAVVRERFIKWVVFILKYDCHDVKRSSKNKPRYVSISDRIGGDEGLTIEETIPDAQNLTGLEILLNLEELRSNQQKEQQILRSIESLVCHPAGYPQSTCYELIQRRMLKTTPQRWQDIATELNTPYGTITSHWKRKCTKRLQEIEKTFS